MAKVGGALGNLDLQGILTNIKGLLIPVTQLVLMISFVSGIFFIFRGVSRLRSFGQSQNMYSSEKSEIAGPLLYLLIGAVLMHIPATTNIVSYSLFGSVYATLLPGDNIILEDSDSNNVTVSNVPTYETSASSKLMTYIDVGVGEEWSDLINVIVMFIQLVGLIAFIRGWFILSHAGQANSQQGSFSKGLIHLIGGIMAINFIPLMQAIAALIF